MKVRFVHTAAAAGGLSSAVERLALALDERGHMCDVLAPPSLTAADDGPVQHVPTVGLQAGGRSDASGNDLLGALTRGRPDLIVVGSGDPDLLAAASKAAPTILHSHMHWAVCPDAGRYWNHVQRECTVRPGWKCLALRPVLGCSGRQRSWRPRYVASQRRLEELVRSGDVGCVAISSCQAELLEASGVPTDRTTTIPNLGMRMSSAELRRAAGNTPPEDRSAVVFLGRLSKEKGAHLLPELVDAASTGGLRVYGSGYLEDELRASGLSASLRGHISQAEVAGVLQWARAVIFPSLWPEPGGIVGIDAELFGVPLAAFAVGGALDWPGAALFKPGDAAAMAEWIHEQRSVERARLADEIAARQRAYWDTVGALASRQFESFVRTGRFVDTGRQAVRDVLGGARVELSPGSSSGRVPSEDGT